MAALRVFIGMLFFPLGSANWNVHVYVDTPIKLSQHSMVRKSSVKRQAALKGVFVSEHECEHINAFCDVMLFDGPREAASFDRGI